MNTVQHLIRRAYGLLVTGANFLQPPVVAYKRGCAAVDALRSVGIKCNWQVHTNDEHI